MAQLGGASGETLSMIETRNGVPSMGSPHPAHRLASFSANTVGMRMPMIWPPRNLVSVTRRSYQGERAGLRDHSVELPLAWDTLEGMSPAILEGEARTGNEVPNGRGNQHLGRSRERRYPGADVHGDAPDVVAR